MTLAAAICRNNGLSSASAENTESDLSVLSSNGFSPMTAIALFGRARPSIRLYPATVSTLCVHGRSWIMLLDLRHDRVRAVQRCGIRQLNLGKKGALVFFGQEARRHDLCQPAGRQGKGDDQRRR